MDANALLCSDLSEALTLEALLNFRSSSSLESDQQSDVSRDIEIVVHALSDVKVTRIDHSMDDLIEDARSVARSAAALYADISVEQYKRRR